MTLSLLHHPSSARSRKVRVALAEIGLPHQVQLESYWLHRPEFSALNVACEVPVLLLDKQGAVVGDLAICEYLDEVAPQRSLLGAQLDQRNETRRLLQWFDQKFAAEVTDNIVGEKLIKRLTQTGQAYAPAIRAGSANIHYHLDYIGFLSERRKWLAGDDFSFADIAAAAHLSLIDYMGDVPWNEHEDARLWYMRVKSRPSFRPLLTEVMGGMAPAEHYANLDF